MFITHVKCNVENHRLIDGKRTVEDVTQVTPPTIEHPTTEINAAGMIMKVDMPLVTHFNAMELEIAHNNGVNCNHLADPGIHNIEFRVARQDYKVAKGQVNYEGFKIRARCVHKSTQKGSIETGNPYGSTEKYSILRYEEEFNGEIVTLIDSTAGIIRINGVDYGRDVESLLK